MPGRGCRLPCGRPSADLAERGGKWPRPERPSSHRAVRSGGSSADSAAAGRASFCTAYCTLLSRLPSSRKCSSLGSTGGGTARNGVQAACGVRRDRGLRGIAGRLPSSELRAPSSERRERHFGQQPARWPGPCGPRRRYSERLDLIHCTATTMGGYCTEQKSHSSSTASGEPGALRIGSASQCPGGACGDVAMSSMMCGMLLELCRKLCCFSSSRAAARVQIGSLLWCCWGRDGDSSDGRGDDQ